MAFTFLDPNERYRRQAARWLARLQSGAGERDRQSFLRWRNADPRHAQAFERVSRHYDLARLLRQSAASSQPAETAERARSRPRNKLAAAMAGVTILAAALAFGGHGTFFRFAPDDVLLVSTRVGEIRQISLEDGTRVTLDTASELKLSFGRSERRAELRRGRARFRIARERRPFVAEADGVKVTSASAVVDLAASTHGSAVRLIAGSARVAAAAGQQPFPEVTLNRGEGLAITPAGAQRLSGNAAQSEWVEGILQFDATPLSAVVDEANRYSVRKIVLGPGVGSEKVTGAFKAGDTALLARSLAAAFGLRLTEQADGDLLLTATRQTGGKKKNGG